MSLCAINRMSTQPPEDEAPGWLKETIFPNKLNTDTGCTTYKQSQGKIPVRSMGYNRKNALRKTVPWITFQTETPQPKEDITYDPHF
jgi:hypothetical protein